LSNQILWIFAAPHLKFRFDIIALAPRLPDYHPHHKPTRLRYHPSPTMLEVFAYKRYKKYKLSKELREANAKEALSKHDEAFIRKSMESKQPSENSSIFKFLQRKKSSHGDAVSPSPNEIAAIKVKDDGFQNPLRDADVQELQPQIPKKKTSVESYNPSIWPWKKYAQFQDTIYL
jgi:hypothetical protein